MKWIRVAPFALGLGLALGLLLPRGSAADEDPGRWRVRVEPSLAVMNPFPDLPFAEAMRITEGPRMLGDQFPYLAGAPRAVSSTNAVEIVPETLHSFLKAAPQEGGQVPARVRTAAGAIAAVRLFLAGPVVEDAATAQRLIETGRGLAEHLIHLDVKVTDHRPASWKATARPLPQDGSIHPVEAWEVSVVALELDRMCRLVHVTARVTADGDLALERTPIVDGPMTIWQIAAVGEYTEAMQRQEEEMHAEAIRARRAYAEALRPARTLDTFWAVGRILHDMEDVRALFGAPDRDVGSGIHIWTYDLPDGTSVVFGGSDERAVYVRHVRGARGGLKGFETLGTIYADGGG